MHPTGVEDSPIQQFYNGSVVLITGGTGFLGKVLVEKLLRSCPQLGQIILLIRGKKDANCQQRLHDMMNEVVLKGVSSKARLKVTVVSGDCMLPNLGLSDSDRVTLIQSVNIIFHVAATVKFDEDLASAVAINVAGTKAMLDMARDVVNLKAFVHVSTAYSQCHLDHIEEKFYTPKYSPEKLIRLTECVDKPYLDHLTPLLLKDSPNTYTYTKAAAEELIRTQSKGLPISVFRPSIVVATRSEPFPGWIDNLYGATGVVVATITGIMRTLHCDPQKVADVVPADMVVNALIATAWKTHVRNMNIETADDQPQVYNFVSAPEKPLLWGEFFEKGMKNIVPTMHAVWYPNLKLNRHSTVHKIQHWLYHVLPACLVDTAASTVGRRTNLMKIIRKVHRFSELISYFSTREWSFSNYNTRELWQSLNPKDKELFPFTFSCFDWDSYFKTYLQGTRQYLLKDDPSTIPRALARNNRFYWIHKAFQTVLCLVTARFLWSFAGRQLLRFVIFITTHFLTPTFQHLQSDTVYYLRSLIPFIKQI